MRQNELIEKIAHDCVNFKETGPCKPHKLSGAMCRCNAYQPLTSRALFIQLSSPQTVIRSSALLYRLKAAEPGMHISYLTHWTDLLPDCVDAPMRTDAGALAALQTLSFDKSYNLDTSCQAGAIMNMVRADKKMGFSLNKGRSRPIDASAYSQFIHTLLPGYDQSPSLATVSVRQAIKDLFQTCSLEYRREMPRLTLPPDARQLVELSGTGVVLSITGQWPWSLTRWANIIHDLKVTLMLLGDENTDLLNRRLASQTGVYYPGPLSMRAFINYTASAPIVVTQPGWQAEMAWALGQQVVCVQTDKEQPLYREDDFAGRMVQIPLQSLTPHKLIDTIHELTERQIPAPATQPQLTDPEALIKKIFFPNTQIPTEIT